MKPPRTIRQAPEGTELKTHLEQVSKVLSNISYGSTMSNGDPEQNLEVWKATATTPAANTEFAVPHGLGRIPFGFHLVRANKAAHVFDSGTAWTTTQIFLKCDVATVAINLLIF